MPDIHPIYAERAEKSEKFSKLISKWWFTLASITLILKFFESYYRFYILHDGADSFKPLMPAK